MSGRGATVGVAISGNCDSVDSDDARRAASGRSGSSSASRFDLTGLGDSGTQPALTTSAP